MPTSYARAGRRKGVGWLSRLRRWPGRISLRAALALCVAALCVGGMANALFFQDAPHPAPIFGRGQQAQPLPKQALAEPPARPKVAALQQPVTPLQPAAPAAAPSPPAPARAAAPVPPLPVPAPNPPPRGAGDDIGALIRNANFAPSAPAAPLPPAPIVDAAQIIAVQKALAMRGFEIGKADGMMGPSTKQAIEKFERQVKLPVSGQVSSRLMRALGVQGGSR